MSSEEEVAEKADNVGEDDEKIRACREAAEKAKEKRKEKEMSDEEIFQRCFDKAQERLQNVAQLDMDEQIKEDMNDDKAMDDWGKAKFNVDSFGKKFGNLITIFVLFNAVTIGIETDFAGKYTAVRAMLDVIEHIYCAVFLVEMIIRIMVDYWEYFTSPMSLIDCCLVNFAVFDTWILPLAVGEGNGLGQLSILRVIRLARLVRLIKLMRSYKKLYLLVCGLVAGLKTLAWVGLLMAITIYMFAIFSVQTIGQSDSFKPEYWESKYEDDDELVEFSTEKYFKNIFISSLTMWECLNDGCTHDVVRPVIGEQMIYFPVFLAFVFLMVYGFLNILVGVFVDAISESAAEQEEMIARQEELGSGSWEHHVRDLWSSLNTDSDGAISRKEFFDAFDGDEMRSLLETLNLADIEAGELFSTLDINNNGTIWKEELVEGVMKFRTALKNPEVSTLLVKKQTEAEFHRCMELVNALGDLLLQKNMIDRYDNFGIKEPTNDMYEDLLAEEPEEELEEEIASPANSPTKSPEVNKMMVRIDEKLEGKFNLRFATPELEDPYLESLVPQTLVCLKVSTVVQFLETVSRAVFDESNVSEGANTLRAIFSAFCCIGTATIAFLLSRCLKNETPWPLRWNVQRMMTALFMVKLVGSALLRPCRLAVALGLESTYSQCTPDLYWELVLLLYTVLGTWLPSRFQNQLLTTSLTARVVMLVILDIGMLGMGVDALSFVVQEFLPICVLSAILLVSCYTFDLERRRSFLMKHGFLKQVQDNINKRSDKQKSSSGSKNRLQKQKSKSFGKEVEEAKGEEKEKEKEETGEESKDNSAEETKPT